MRKLFRFLSIIILTIATLIPITETKNVSAAPTGCTPSPRPDPSSYGVGEYAFIDHTDSPNKLFKDLAFDVKTLVEAYPSNYIYEETEIAIVQPDGKLINYVGAVKNKPNYCVQFDLGNPANYKVGQTYEVVFRLVFTVLTTEVQYKKSPWKSYDPDINNSNDFNKTLFNIVTPKPTDPKANPLLNKTTVETDDASFTKKITKEGTPTTDPRNDMESNTLVLTNKNDVTLKYVSDIWYTHRAEREVYKDGNKQAKETYYGAADNQRQMTKNEVIPLSKNMTNINYQFNVEYFRTDNATPNNPIYRTEDKAKVTILRDIFNKFYTLKVSMNGDNYSVKMEQKAGLDPSEVAMLNNSLTDFGIDLNKPSFVVTELSYANIDSYQAKTEIGSLGADYTATCSGCTAPILRIGYPGMFGESYTYSIPLKDVLGINFSNIPDDGIVNVNTGVFRPEISLKQNKDVFKFPAGSNFNWDKYKDIDSELTVFVYEVTNLTSVPTDKNDFIKNKSNYTFKYYDTIKDKPSDGSLDSLSQFTLTDSGNYIIGAKLTNKLGETAFEFKEFKVLFGSTFGYLPVANNFNYQLDSVSIINNGNIKTHGLDLIVGDSLIAPSAYNYKHNALLIGSPNGGTDFLKLFNHDLTDRTFNNTIPPNTAINDIVEYSDGFLIGTSTGLYYLDLTTNDISPITTPATDVTDIELEGIIVYIAGSTVLTVGKISNLTFTESDSMVSSDVFNNASDHIGDIEIMGNKIMVTPSNNYGTSPSKVVVIDKI